MDTPVWNSADYERHALFVSELAASLVTTLSPRPEETILDLGCGTGLLARRIRHYGCRVIGIDSSQSMVDAAQTRGIEAYLCRGDEMTFLSKFHAAISNAALHWMKRQRTVLQGVYRALKPGGRFVAELGSENNLSKIRTAIAQALQEKGLDYDDLNPWFFPNPLKYRSMLMECGFEVTAFEQFNRPTRLPTDIRGWLKTFAGSFWSALPERDREAFTERVRELSAPQLRQPDGSWVVDYVRLRFVAIKRPSSPTD